MASRLDTPLDDLVSANRTHRGRGRGRGGARGGRGFGGRSARGLHRGGRGGRGGFGAKRDPNFSDDTVWAHDKFDEHQAAVAAEEDAPEESEKATLNSRMQAIRRTLKSSGDAGAEGSAKVRLENLDFNITEEELKELFTDSGDVQSAKVDYDKSGRSNGTATVIFARRSDALSAVKKYNGVELEGRILSVALAASAPQKQQQQQQQRMAATGARAEAPRLMISTVNDRFTPRGRGGFRGSRGGRGGYRGGRGGSRGPAPTSDSLDADLDSYMSK